MSAAENLYAELSRGVRHAQVRQHLIDAYRAEVLAEAASAVETMWLPAATRLRRMAAAGPLGKDTSDGTQPPAGESTQPTPDFFQPGRTYTRGSGRWTFHCLAVAPTPWMDETRAVGYLTRTDGTGTTTDMDPDDWATGGWTEATEGEGGR